MLVVALPVLCAVIFTYTRHYLYLHEIVEEEIWFDVFTDLSPLDSWQERWGGQIKHLERIGGCDCHTAQYSVRATRAAINDFPNRYRGFDDVGTEGEIDSLRDEL